MATALTSKVGDEIEFDSDSDEDEESNFCKGKVVKIEPKSQTITIQKLSDHTTSSYFIDEIRIKNFQDIDLKISYWQKLKNVPLKNERISPPITYNNKIVIAEQVNTECGGRSMNYGLCAYNPITDEWSKWIRYPHHLGSGSCVRHKITMDKTNNIMYLLDIAVYIHDARKLDFFIFCAIDLENEKIIKHSSMTGSLYERIPHQTIVINGQIHVITQNRINSSWSFQDNFKHFIFNEKMNKFMLKHTVNGSLMAPQKLIYIASKKELLLLVAGGYMYLYRFGRVEWIKLDHKLTFDVEGIGNIITNDDIYIIFFGGRNSKSIHIMDTAFYYIHKCKIECPMDGNVNAVLMDGNEFQLNDVIINGYWRKLIHFQQIPMELIALISTYYRPQYIHLIQAKHSYFSSDKYHGLHYKILLDDILNNFS